MSYLAHYNDDLFGRGWNKAERQEALSILEYILGEKRFEHADNFRFARAGNPVEVNAYIETQQSGCCGSYDTMRTATHAPDGTPIVPSIVMVGCNYGY